MKIISPLHFNTWNIFVFHATQHNDNWPVVTNPSKEKYFSQYWTVVFQYLALLVNEIPPPDELTHHSYLHLPSFVHIFIYHHLYISAKLDWGFHSLKCFLHWKVWGGGQNEKSRQRNKHNSPFHICPNPSSAINTNVPQSKYRRSLIFSLIHPSICAGDYLNSDDWHEVAAGH